MEANNGMSVGQVHLLQRIARWRQVRKTKKWLTIVLDSAFQFERDFISEVFSKGNLHDPVVVFVLGYLFGASFSALKADVGHRRKIEQEEVIQLFWELVRWLTKRWAFKESLRVIWDDPIFLEGGQAAEKEIEGVVNKLPGMALFSITGFVAKHKPDNVNAAN